jgi:hypothetical protein
MKICIWSLVIDKEQYRLMQCTKRIDETKCWKKKDVHILQETTNRYTFFQIL